LVPGLANTKTVTVQPVGKDSVVLATTKTRKQNKPSSLLHKSVMKKEFRRKSKAVENQVMIYIVHFHFHSIIYMLVLLDPALLPLGGGSWVL